MVSSSPIPLTSEIHTYLQEPILIRRGNREGGSLLFTAERMFTIDPDGADTGDSASVITTVYEYRLLDRLERELLVYHWQPGPRYAGPDHPHLHVSASLRAATSAVDEREIDLDKLHLPTGQVTLAAVVRSLITEFGVEPLRPDWARVLDAAEAGELAVSNQAN